MLRIFKGIFLVVFFLFFCVSFIFAEDITITTYYPSPFGSYNSLQTDKLGVGDNNGDGSFTAADVPTTTGNVWIAGNVGVGTTDPVPILVSKITVKQADANEDVMANLGYDAPGVTTAVNGRAYQNFYHGEGVGALGYIRDGAFIAGVYGNAPPGNANYAAIFETGNVGIGTTAPVQRLHVAGNIMGAAPNGTNTWRLDRLAGVDPWVRLYQGSGAVYNSFAVGPFWANGLTRFDLAEITPVRKEDNLEPGDVVCIDTEAAVRMKRSQQAYDSLVSGIVSDPNTASMVIGGGYWPGRNQFHQ